MLFIILSQFYILLLNRTRQVPFLVFVESLKFLNTKTVKQEIKVMFSLKNDKIVAEGITFDDVLLIPAKSDFVPSQAGTSTRLTKNIVINIPVVSAAKDTVT